MQEGHLLSTRNRRKSYNHRCSCWISFKDEAQVAIDLLMMMATGGKERDEHEWHKIFMEAGFKHYKIRPAVGFLSVIELYP